MALRGVKMNSTLLYKQIRVAKFNKQLALALTLHDLLLQDDKTLAENRILERSHLNKYQFKGKIIRTKEERLRVVDYIESIYKNDNKAFNSKRFSKVKFKFKKWLDENSLTTGERNLYEKILTYVNTSNSDRRINLDKVMFSLERCGKIKRYNDKKKAIIELVTLFNETIDLDLDSTSQLNCRVVSLLFKIPLKNKVKLTSEEQEKILLSYFSENFNQFEVIYSAQHLDETVGHVHAMLNGLNKETKKYDFVQKQYEYILEKKKLSNFPRKFSECDMSQVRKVGEELQFDFYEYANQLIQYKDFRFKKKVYDSEEEKLHERGLIRKDTNRPIADRNFNTAKYYRKIALSAKRSFISYSEKIVKIVESALGFAREYAFTSSDEIMKSYRQEEDLLHAIDKSVAQKINKHAQELQPTQKQKNDFTRSSK